MLVGRERNKILKKKKRRKNRTEQNKEGNFTRSNDDGLPQTDQHN